MKVLSFKNGKLEWSIPLDEVSLEMKRMLRVQWREFIYVLDDVKESSIESKLVDHALIAMLEREFTSA